MNNNDHNNNDNNAESVDEDYSKDFLSRDQLLDIKECKNLLKQKNNSNGTFIGKRGLLLDFTRWIHTLNMSLNRIKMER